MPRLAIVDQNVSAGGGEAFLRGLVENLIKLPEIADWDVTLFVRPINSCGQPVAWAKELKDDKLKIHFLRDDPIRRFFDRLSASPRIWGIRGTSRLQKALSQLLVSCPVPFIREAAGDISLSVKQLLDHNEFDVIYFAWPYWLECPQIKTPIVATPHDLNYKMSDTLSADVRLVMERQMPVWLDRSFRLVVSAEFIKRQLVEHYPSVLNKVEVVRPGVPCRHYEAKEEDLKKIAKKFSLPDRFVLTVGWLTAHKNQTVVMEAAGLLRQEGLNIALVCAGPNSHQLKGNYTGRLPPYVEQMLLVADRYGLVAEKDYYGAGYLSNFELQCLYKLACALIVPSVYEAGSFPAIEAMLMKCPVIMAASEPLMEQVNLVNGNAWLFDPLSPQDLAQKIKSVIEDPQERRTKTEAAAVLVKEAWSWESFARGYLKTFTEAVAEMSPVLKL